MIEQVEPMVGDVWHLKDASGSWDLLAMPKKYEREYLFFECTIPSETIATDRSRLNELISRNGLTGQALWETMEYRYWPQWMRDKAQKHWDDGKRIEYLDNLDIWLDDKVWPKIDDSLQYRLIDEPRDQPATCPTCNKVPEVHYRSNLSDISALCGDMIYNSDLADDWPGVTCPKCIEKREELSDKLSDKPKTVNAPQVRIKEYAIIEKNGLLRVKDYGIGTTFLEECLGLPDFRGVKFEGQKDDEYWYILRMFINDEGHVYDYATPEQLESGELKAAVPVVAAFEEAIDEC